MSDDVLMVLDGASKEDLRAIVREINRFTPANFADYILLRNITKINLTDYILLRRIATEAERRLNEVEDDN